MSFSKFITISAILWASLATAAQAGPAEDALQQCMAKSVNKDEQRLLAKWLYFGFSQYPEVKSLSTIPEQERTEVNTKVAQLTTRLLTESCRAEVEAVRKPDNNLAMKDTIAALGVIATKELLTEEKVPAQLSTMTQQMDKSLIDSLCGCHQ